MLPTSMSVQRKQGKQYGSGSFIPSAAAFPTGTSLLPRGTRAPPELHPGTPSSPLHRSSSTLPPFQLCSSTLPPLHLSSSSTK